jgi:hypothetical protein
VGEGLFGPVAEQEAVGQAGEQVVAGEEFGAFLGGLAVGEVGEHRHVVEDALIIVADGGDGQPLGKDRPVAAAVPGFAVPVVGVGKLVEQGVEEAGGMVAGVDQRGFGADDFFGRHSP